MGGTLETKTKIVELLSEKKMTLTDLCKRLDLAPSTMNQHLGELVRMGAIKQVDSPYAIKWKYYEVRPEFKGFDAAVIEDTVGSAKQADTKNKYPQTKVFATNTIYRVVGAALLLVIAGFAVYGIYGTPSTPYVTSTVSSGASGIAAAQEAQAYVPAEQYIAPNSSTAAGSTIFSISDAPGNQSLQALNITVTTVLVHSAGIYGKWYLVFNGSKTFDLVQLDNISEVISGANIPNGTYNEVLLKVSNITAILNNQSESVFAPNNTLLVHAVFNITNGTANLVNIDINLSDSVHITPNGQLILLPAMGISKFHGQKFDVDRNYTVAPGNAIIDCDYHFYMGVNGTMTSNNPYFNRTSDFQIGMHGKIAVVANQIGLPFIIMPHRGGMLQWNGNETATGNYPTGPIGIGTNTPWTNNAVQWPGSHALTNATVNQSSHTWANTTTQQGSHTWTNTTVQQGSQAWANTGSQQGPSASAAGALGGTFSFFHNWNGR